MITLHHCAVTLGDDAGNGGEGGVIHHAEHHPIHLLLPDLPLDSFQTGNKESLLDIVIKKLFFISTYVRATCHGATTFSGPTAVVALLLLGVLDGKLEGAVHGVHLLKEAVKLLV